TPRLPPNTLPPAPRDGSGGEQFAIGMVDWDRSQAYFWDWRRGPGSKEAAGRDGNFWLKAARFPAAWNLCDATRPRSNRDPVLVGVLDGGFLQHNDIPYREIVATPAVGAVVIPGRERKMDHGNHISGIIAARFDDLAGINGGSPRVEILASSYHLFSADLLSDAIAWQVVWVRAHPRL